MNMIEKLRGATELAGHCINPRGRVLGFYYDQHPNVGDALNIDLAKGLFGKDLIMPPGIQYRPHVLMVGSILGQMTKNSQVWGSGVLSPEIFRQCKGLGQIHALRGQLTRSLVEQHFAVKLSCPLGDPGLLLPRVYPGQPATVRSGIGIIPHLLDEASPWVAQMIAEGARLVSVRLPPEEFAHALSGCQAVLSSSLHGLILADAYDVPNARFSLPTEIPGGDFKFDDYYSATLCPTANQRTLRVAADDRRSLTELVEGADIKPYAHRLDDLLEASPLGRM